MPDLEPNSGEIVFVGDNNEPFTTSLVIAAETGNQHKNILELIRNNREDLNEVGRVAFETRPFETPGGKQLREVGLLDEPASALLMTYLRNTPKVKEFKKRLVRDFYAMRRMLEADLDLSDPLAAIDAAISRTQEAVAIAREERARAERAERQVEVEQRHRRAIEGGDGIDPTTFGKKYFSEVPARKFDEHLYSHGYLINQRNSRVCGDGKIRDGHDHRKPTAKGRRFFYPHDNGTYNGRRRFQPRVRPQMEIALRDALVAEGLPVNMHSTGLVLINTDELKGLGA